MTWGTFLENEQKAIPPASEFDPSDEIKSNDLLLSRCKRANWSAQQFWWGIVVHDFF